MFTTKVFMEIKVVDNKVNVGEALHVSSQHYLGKTGLITDSTIACSLNENKPTRSKLGYMKA